MGAIFGVVDPDSARLEPAALAIIEAYGAAPAAVYQGPGIVLAAVSHPYEQTSSGALASETASGWVIAADLQLDNPGAFVRAENRATASSPAELVASKLNSVGEEVFDKILGDFGIALWHAPERRLILGRDHVGARPLYYAHDGQRFAFATDARALFSLGWIPCLIGERAVAHYLVCPVNTAGLPLCQDVHLLAPGTRLEWQNGRITQHRWWRPEQISVLPRLRPEECAEQLRHLFELAVSARIRPNAAVGAHFSGGLDSSVVALEAARQLLADGSGLRALYSWSPGPGLEFPPLSEADERPGLLEQAAMIGAPCRFAPSTRLDPLAVLALDHHVQGMAAMFEELPVIDQARQDRVGILLSGWGGDEFASFNLRGYPAWLLVHGRWLTLLRLSPLSSRRLGSLVPGIRWIAQRALLPHLPDVLYHPLARRWTRDQAPLWSGELAARHADLLTAATPFDRPLRSPREWQLALLENGHLGARMVTWAHWSAGSGLVHRYPLTDRRLIEFILGLHPEQLFPDHRSRELLRRACSGHGSLRRNKADPANEAKRLQWVTSMLNSLNQHRLAGGFDGDCPWLDMGRFRDAIGRTFERPLEPGRVGAAMRLLSVAKIWTLWERQRAGRLCEFSAPLAQGERLIGGQTTG